jgi:hypothetical protein
MERSDERLSTRDIASGGDREPEAERDTALADPVESPPADTATEPEGRTDRDVEQPDEGGAVLAGDRPDRDDDTDVRSPAGAVAADADADADARPEADTAATADTGARPEADTAATRTAAEDEGGPLLEGADEFQSRWEEIQVRFVDEPRGAVEDADALVATVMQRLAEGFASEREHLEAQWGRGEDISTEDLRVALQRYRSFFRRLLAT